jgi:hypothetical protein
MNAAQSDNFTYDYLMRILNAVKEKFNLRLLGDGLAADSALSQLFLRHDVDVNINRALTMAEIEAEHGIQATYMFIPHSRLYDIQRDRELLRRFIYLKHEVALHFDVDEHRRVQHATIADVLTDIEQDCQIISDITGESVRSVSFHRPMSQFLKGEFTVAGRTNAYSAVLMESYISDSKGEWRNGEPLPYLQAAVMPVLQLLIHPIWWGVRHMKPRERLEEFYLDATAELTSAARARFDADLAFSIPAVRRSNYTEA